MENLWPLIYFNVFIILMLAADICLFHKKDTKVCIKEATLLSVFWISISLLFNVYVYYSRGSEAATNFLTAYLIEKTLSVDNLFVFLLIFKYFHTPPKALHTVLFYGVLGAIVMRAFFIFFGIGLISYFHWMIYVFGVILIITGVKLGFEKDKKVDPEKNPVIKLFRSFFRVSDTYDKDKFLTVKGGVTYATPLMIVLLSIETTDVIFAIDSVPAVLAITTDPFIVYTSNIFAILGLRSLFFLLAHVMTLFHYLHYAISFILVFVGLKMLLSNYIHFENITALAVIFVTLLLSIIASICFPQKQPPLDL